MFWPFKKWDTPILSFQMGYTRPIDLHLKNANRSNCEPEMSCHLRMISLLFPLPTIIIPVRENSEVAIIYPDIWMYIYINIIYPYAPWWWYIYLDDWVIFRANFGKYASTMEHMGICMVVYGHYEWLIVVDYGYMNLLWGCSWDCLFLFLAPRSRPYSNFGCWLDSFIWVDWDKVKCCKNWVSSIWVPMKISGYHYL